jgi:heme-degrading monooxygenase HmoA
MLPPAGCFRECQRGDHDAGRFGVGCPDRKEAFSKELMPRVLIIHEVENYPAWKRVFDHAAGIRKAAGERSFQVLKFENDPNRIVHFSEWTSHADARAFFESPELVRIRLEAGVKSPEFIYLDELEAGTL